MTGCIEFTVKDVLRYTDTVSPLAAISRSVAIISGESKVVCVVDNIRFEIDFNRRKP